ncbi:hypothetical protein BGZ97_012107 [Linnemannia gamsii]|uniref:C3H1-type domain-containing protein n=1 Tax=Linnemannia gamsii TaxID=64522 RepID=A0A9P6RIV3_9FUNG|nr:hypothetical protein BGZ97_012107 [Linnemannia gamsii]
MSDKELLAQIAQLTGAINKHQAQSQGYYGYSPRPTPARGGYGGHNGYAAYSGHTGYNMRGRGRGRGAPFPHAAAAPFNRSLTLNNKTPTPASSATSTTPSASTITSATVATKAVPALTPVESMQPRPTINKSFIPIPSPSRHLTLVNKSTASTSTTPGPLPSPASSPPKTNALVTAPGQQWIQSKGKNMSLMNASTFQKTMVAKEKSIRTAKEKRLKLMQIKAKRAQDLRRGIVTMGGQEYSKSADGRKLIMRDTSQDNVFINGVEFRMDPRGNKLVRTAAAGSATAATTTGKAPSVPNASSMATPVATPKQFSIGGVVYVRTHSGNLVRANLVKKQLLEKRAAAAQQSFKTKRSRMAPKKARPFCKYYTRFEVTCKLSHTPSPHTVPACVHFQRAACSKDDCVYPHVRTNPQALICRPFATEGWCEAGINCKNRHVWMCPDFVTEAGCKKKCGLPHVPNGGIRVKKSSDGNDIASGGNDKTWVRPDYQLSSSIASTSRHMENQDQDAEGGSGADGTATAAGRNKNRQYDENFIPLDLGDDFENQQAGMLDEDEDVVMSDQEVEEEEDEEEEDDVSSDGMETGAEDDDDEGEEVSLGGSEEVDLEDEDDDGKEMDEEDEYNMYQEQLRYEDDDDY